MKKRLYKLMVRLENFFDEDDRGLQEAIDREEGLEECVEKLEKMLKVAEELQYWKYGE